MSILRYSKVKNLKPRIENSPIPRFISSIRKTLDVPVYDKDGKLVQTIRKKVVEHKIIDQEEFLNKGVDCDLFSVENLQKAGINPQVIRTPLIKNTLEQNSVITDFIEGYDYESLVENQENNNSFINNE